MVDSKKVRQVKTKGGPVEKTKKLPAALPDKVIGFMTSSAQRMDRQMATLISLTDKCQFASRAHPC
ncbi:MAG: hypothetical protein M3O07_08455, partial [Pseudomonadota bacterium]|nr:hypothetical protein [Pseudomonadota bacterium]